MKYEIVEVKLRSRLGRILSINEWRVILEDEEGYRYRVNAWAGVFKSKYPLVGNLLFSIKRQISKGKMKKLKYLPENLIGDSIII